MRFGVTLGTLLTHDDIVRCARVADKDASMILIPESWGRDAFVTLGVLSSVTNHAMLGSGIISIYSRTASAIAMASATLDAYSNGRAFIGLGASSKVIVENWHGLVFKDNVTRMREYVESIRLILKGEKVNYSGKFVKINDFKLGFKPIRSSIPIYIAAVKEKMLRLASEIGDGLILFLYPIHMVEKIREKVKDKEILYVIITSISEDEEKAMERAKKTIAFYTAVGKSYAELLEESYREEVESIREEYARNGMTNIHQYVSKDMLDSLAIYGDAEECNKRFKRFAKDVTPVLHLNPVYDAEESMRDLLEAIV